MLNMVGGALKKINGIQDPNTLGRQSQTNKKDSVPQYKPTPIHVLKAKSSGKSCEYDPVSNFSASTSSRITLSSCSKRLHSGDAVIAAKKSRIETDKDEIEAKFSDSDCEQTSIPTSSSVHAAGSTVYTEKNSDATSLQFLSVNHREVKVPKSGDSNVKKVSSANLPLVSETTKLSATRSQPIKASTCSSSSKLQANATVSRNNLLAKMASVEVNKTDSSVKQHSSDSKAVSAGGEKQQSHKVHSSSLSSGRSEDKSMKKVLSTNLPVTAATTKSSSTRSQPKTSSYCLPSSKSQTGVTVSHNHLVKSAKMPSVEVNKGRLTLRQTNSMAVAVGAEKQHSHKDCSSSSGSSNKFSQNTDRNSDSSKTKHLHDNKSNNDGSCRSNDVAGTKQRNKDGHKHGESTTRTKSNQHRSSEHSCSVSAEEGKVHRHSSDNQQKHAIHEKSEQNDKVGVTASSYMEREKEKLHSRTSEHKHKSKTYSSSTVSGAGSKRSSSCRHDEDHKTSHHKQNDAVANSHHSSQESSSRTKSHQSKTATTASGKESKSSHHKQWESAGGQQTQQVGRSVESCHSTTASSSSSVIVTYTTHAATVRKIELFGEDSDTESDLFQLSSASAQVKEGKPMHHKSASSVTSQSCGDTVVLLPLNDLSDASDDEDTFEQCQEIYNEFYELGHQQLQSEPTSSSVSCS